MAKARIYSYLRFSSPQQKRGDSKRRQTELIKKWAEDLKLEIAEAYMDEGVSAYSGANIADGGALGIFLAKVKAGEIARGSVLVVESLDRLSRQAPLDALPIFTALLNSGISIVTGADGQHFTRESINKDSFLLFGSIMVMARAHEESKTKSKRLAAAWTEKRKKAQEHLEPMTKIVPAWIRMINERGTKRFELIPEHVRIVERIFRSATNGLGRHTIAKQLNEEGVPVFGRGQAWHSSYIIKILENDAVIGTYHPHKMEIIESTDPTKPDKKRRKPVGPPIKNFYPSAICEDLWYAAQSALKGRALLQLKGRTGAKAGSPFGGLAVCGECGSALISWTAGEGGRLKNGRLVRKLICAGHRRGIGCTTPTRHEQATTIDAVFNALRAFHAYHGVQDETPVLMGQIDAKKAEIAKLRGDIKNLIGFIKSQTMDSEEIRDEMNAINAQIKECQAEISRLHTAIETTAAAQDDKAHLTNFQVFREAFAAEELGRDTPEHQSQRQKAAVILRRHVSRIVIDLDSEIDLWGYWITPKTADGQPDLKNTFLVPTMGDDHLDWTDEHLFGFAQLVADSVIAHLQEPDLPDDRRDYLRHELLRSLAMSPKLRTEPYLSGVAPLEGFDQSPFDRFVQDLEAGKYNDELAEIEG
ncbi:recombinase family protein [Lacibacterium aquatile]|uniref:Recombinase family protein n=1 Tax=Lacibacterium aquatile TaxID=1168082 RepID=A0ABW5DQR1_9PROT